MAARRKEPIYFSVDRFTATVLTNFTGQLWDAAAIYVVPHLGDAPKIYATSQQLGLKRGFTVGLTLIGDDIDALAIQDAISPGVYNGNEIIWISLDGPSPTRPPYLINCDGIIQVSPAQNPLVVPPGGGPPRQGIVILSAFVLDMSCPPAPGVYDELDAIALLDPGCPKDDRKRDPKDIPGWCINEKW